jgi:hypothetical protein
VGPGDVLDAVVKRKIPSPRQVLWYKSEFNDYRKLWSKYLKESIPDDRIATFARDYKLLV